MKKVKKITLWVIGIAGILILCLYVFLRSMYGGGETYTDMSTNPLYDKDRLVEVFAYDDPIGNVAVSKDTSSETRVFFTIHPESRPEYFKLMEIRNNQAFAYPDSAYQKHFNTVLGVFTDQQNRLWVIDHGNHGFDPVTVTAFDLDSDTEIHKYAFPDSVAKKLSFFNDLSVSPDGKYLAVANVSFFGKKPSLAFYNLETGNSKNLLENHSSVRHEGYVPVTPAKKMRFFGGAVDLLTGIDGIDFSRDGKYIYYAAMGHSGLYRIPTAIAANFDLSAEAISSAVEFVAKKPLSDGIRTDFEGNIYITDIENQGVYIVDTLGNGRTLIKDSRVRWADGLSITNDGTFYLADSDIPDQMMQPKAHIEAHKPYYIFKFKSLQAE